MKSMKKGVSILTVLVILISNAVASLAVPLFYEVDGDSMVGSFENKEVIKVVGGDWKDGDIVVAELSNGKTVIKRVEGDKLVGNSDGSHTFKLSEVKRVIGKVDKTSIEDTDFELEGRALASADIDLKENPIVDVIATRESAIFLHQDTSVSGIGSNVANVLGMSGGVTQSTGEWVRIAGPTGIVKLVSGADHVFGLREDVDRAGLYNIVWFNQNINNPNSQWVSDFLVKDVATRGTAESNPHQSTIYIDEMGGLKIRGSEYGGLNIGNNFPADVNRYPGWTTFVMDKAENDPTKRRWEPVIQPGGQNILYPVSGSGWFLTVNHASDYNQEVITVSSPFRIDRDIFSIEIEHFSPTRHPEFDRNRNYHEVQTIIEVYKSSDLEVNGDVKVGRTPVFTLPNMRNNYTSEAWRNRVVRGLEPGTEYRIRVRSRYVQWRIRLRDRQFVEEGMIRVVQPNSNGRFSAINEDGKILVGNTREPLWLSGGELSEEVRFIPEKLVASSSSGQMGGLDTNNNIWLWSSHNNAQRVSLPDINGQPFHSTYEILDLELGSGFQMIRVRNKLTNDLNVMVWGSNAYGKLGMGEPGTVIIQQVDTGEVTEDGTPIFEEREVVIGDSILTPTLVARPNGQVLTNIRSIAAGNNFSVIVQDTEDGQLVWTSGLNNSGQLGGGVSLVRDTPQLVPGPTNIDRVTPVLTEILMFNDTNEQVLRTGGGLSYTRDAVLHPGVDFYPKEFYVAEYRINSPMYTHAVYVDKDENIKHTRAYDGHYNTTSIFDAAVDKGIMYDAERNATEVDYSVYNNGQINLRGVQKAIPYCWGTLVLDSAGRIWISTYGSYPSGDRMVGQGASYNSVGEYYPGSRNIGRSVQFRPAKTNFTTIDDTKYRDIAVDVGRNSSTGFGAAITESRDLRRLRLYVEPWDLPDINGKADKLFSTRTTLYLRTVEDRIYAWGTNGNSKKGTGNNTSYSTPTEIPKSYFNNEKIIQIVSNDYVTLFLSDNGNVYGSGTNYYGLFGETGLSMSTVYSRPVLLENTSKLNLKDIKLGGNYAVGLDNLGRVWAWGYAAEGSLGDNFTSNRNFFSTAVGNDLPQMRLLDTNESRYYSINSIYPEKRLIEINAEVVEPDFERTIIYSDMFGKRATTTISSYEKDYYDKPVPQNIKLRWDLKDIPQTLASQALTKITVEDERGGLIEQFIASPYIIDNELPSVPQWEDMYTVNNSGDSETLIKIEPDGSQRYNSSDKAIRVTTQVTQKAGQNRAPVSIQYQYRQRQPWGYPQWEDPSKPENWHTVSGNTVDFFQGFQGETEIRIRAVDGAGNVSQINPTTRRIVIGDAGVVIANTRVTPGVEDNRLYNDITFDAQSNSNLIDFIIERESAFSSRVEIGKGDLKVSGNSYRDVNNLKGNTEYTYYIKGRNQVSEGAAAKIKASTFPYAPIDHILRINAKNDGLDLNLRQSRENSGVINYRVVIIDEATGKHYQEDREGINPVQDINFNITSEVAGMELINNPLKVKVLYRGINPEWKELIIGDNIVLTVGIEGVDSEPPSVSTFRINNGIRTLYADGDNKVTLQVRALDNLTEVSKLQVRFSLDGYTWIGLNSWGNWGVDVWGPYKTEYVNFPLGALKDTKKNESRVVYVAVRDEGGNIGYGYTELNIVSTETPLLPSPEVVNDNVNQGNTWGGSTETNDSINFEAGTGSGNSFIYLNAEQAQIRLSEYFDITNIEVGGKKVPGLLLQYSFDGVIWSEWEPVQYFNYKYVTLPIGDGLKTIHIRGREPESSIVGQSISQRFILDTQAPHVTIRSASSNFIAINGNISLEVEFRDNMVTSIPFKVETFRFIGGKYVKISEAKGASRGRRVVPIELRGLPEGQVKVVITAEDGAKNFTIVERVLWSKGVVVK